MNLMIPNRFANRTALDLYRKELDLEQIALFEYMIDIARYSRGTFQLKYVTIQEKLRINRRRLETLFTWLIELELLKEIPCEAKNKPRRFSFDLGRLIKNPELIYAHGIPKIEYDYITSRPEQKYKRKIIAR